jgi:hypothetical protein
MKHLKKLITAVVLLTAVAAASAQVTAFRFRPERIRAGTVFHYLKTNIDGSQPENVSLYIAAADRIEAFKFHEKGTRAGLVVAEMDWPRFCARRLESWQVSSGTDKKLFATLEADPAAGRVSVSIPTMKPAPERIEIGRFPFHIYNFDLASLNVSFAHLADPEKPFTVGVADPTFSSDGPLLAYKGDLNVVYERDETRNGVKCRRYAASGPGIGGRGTIWVNKRRFNIEDMEFDVPDNPEWKTFKLRLVRTEKMSAAGWKDFIAAHFLSSLRGVTSSAATYRRR